MSTEAWIVTVNARPVIMVSTLAAAMAWCATDSYTLMRPLDRQDTPLRWLVYDDCLRTAGPYAPLTNRGYMISRVADIGWD